MLFQFHPIKQYYKDDDAQLLLIVHLLHIQHILVALQLNEKGSVDKDKYGFLERENGVYYFKLNVKIGLVKR